MTFDDHLARAAQLSASPDSTDLASLRARLFGHLRASGWAPSGHARGTPGATESDLVLLRAFVGGDAVAFDTLFDRHAARLNGHARRWLSSADAADAVQDTFIVLFERAPTLLDRDEDNLGGFLFVTLQNKLRRTLAKRARETPVAEPDTNERAPGDDGITAVLRREDAGRLAHLLDRACSPLEQHVVMLDLEDRSDAEIVAELEITPVYVRQLRYRARKKLRAALAEPEQGSS